MNFVIRRSVWPLICGDENESFFDFTAKCFSKVAQGRDLAESGDRLLRVEGRDAGLGLAARRIATALTKDEAKAELLDATYVAYRARSYTSSGDEATLIEGRMEPKPDQVRVDGVATINSLECFIHQPDSDDEARVTLELVGATGNVSKCKACLIRNDIVKTDALTPRQLDLCEREHVDQLAATNGKYYNSENVVDGLSCVAHGLIGKVCIDAFEKHAAKFGAVDSVKSSCPGAEWNGNAHNTFLVKYKEAEGIQVALSKGTHFYMDQEFKFIPYRLGDMESERQSRLVFLASLPPTITEPDLIARFEPEGIVAARLMENVAFGYLLMAKKSTAQRMHKNGHLDYYHGQARNNSPPVQSLDLSHVNRLLGDEARRQILREAEIGLGRHPPPPSRPLTWLKAAQPSLVDNRKRKVNPVTGQGAPKTSKRVQRNNKIIMPSMNILGETRTLCRVDKQNSF